MIKREEKASNEIIFIEDLFNSLASVCRRIHDELLNRTYNHSLLSLLHRIIHSILYEGTKGETTMLDHLRRERDLLAKRVECERIIHCLDTFLKPCFLSLIETLQILSRAKKMKREDVERIVDHAVSPIREITSYIINDWLVTRIRELGKVREDIFDDYNEFRNKWNNIIDEIERLVSTYGFDIEIPERARELGVLVEE